MPRLLLALLLLGPAWFESRLILSSVTLSSIKQSGLDPDRQHLCMSCCTGFSMVGCGRRHCCQIWGCSRLYSWNGALLRISRRTQEGASGRTARLRVLLVLHSPDPAVVSRGSDLHLPMVNKGKVWQ